MANKKKDQNSVKLINHAIRYKNVGRKTVMTKEMVQKLENGFIMGCSDREACILAGIGKSTLDDYCKKNDNFRTKKELLKNNPSLKARMIIYKELEIGDKQTAQWYLERKNKNEFSTRTENMNTNLNPEDIIETEDEKEAMKEIAKKMFGLKEK